MTTQVGRPPTSVYDHMVHVVAAWILAHTAKPLLFAFGALVTMVSSSVAVAVATIAQLDLEQISTGQVVGGGAGVVIVAWSIRFMHNVYQESLDVTRANLEAEREDRAEDRKVFREEIRIRDEIIAEQKQEISELNSQVGKVLSEISAVRSQLNGG